jgi:hypothetical protein
MKGVTTTAHFTPMATKLDPGKSSVPFTRIDAARIAHEDLAQLLLSCSKKLRPAQTAPFIKESSAADGPAEGIGSRAHSLSLIISACVLSFTMWIVSLFPFPVVERWNCMELYVCHELSFVFQFDQGCLCLRCIGFA